MQRQYLIQLLALVALAAVLVTGCGKADAPTTLKMAVLQDPSRDLFLYALDAGLVQSDQIKLELTRLPMAAVIEAVASRQFDILEASVMAIPGAHLGGLPLLMISPALVNQSGTLLASAAAGPITSLAQLDGKTLGVASLGGTFVLESRALLGLYHGLDVTLPSGKVRYQEVPAETIPALLQQGKLDAAVLMHQPAYRASSTPGVQVLANITRELKAASGLQSVVNSVLVTYQAVSQDRPQELRAALALLRDSRDYFLQHQAKVINAIAQQQQIDPAFLTWWLEGQDFAAGMNISDYQSDIQGLWSLAQQLGDLKSLPPWQEVTWR